MKNKLNELGYKVFYENNTLFVEADYTKDPTVKTKIQKVMKDYKKVMVSDAQIDNTFSFRFRLQFVFNN